MATSVMPLMIVVTRRGLPRPRAPWRRCRRGTPAARSTRTRRPASASAIPLAQSVGAAPSRRRRARARCRAGPRSRSSIGPGSTSFTSTPVPPRSSYIASAHPHIANLAALYAASFGDRDAAAHARHEHDRARAACRACAGNTARLMRTGEWKSTSMTCCDVGRGEVGDARALGDRGVVHEHVEAAERVPRCRARPARRARGRRDRRPTSASRACARGTASSTASSRSAPPRDDPDRRAAFRERSARARRRCPTTRR